MDNHTAPPEPVTMASVLTRWLETARAALNDPVFRAAEDRVRTVLIPRLGFVEAQRLSAEHLRGPQMPVVGDTAEARAQAAFDHDLVAVALDRAVTDGLLTINPLAPTVVSAVEAIVSVAPQQAGMRDG